MSNDIERQFSKSKEYYKILGLNSDCTDEQIKQSFLTLCKKYHPDNKTTGNNEKFILLREAYEVVKDASSRSIYDRFLDTRGATSYATHAQTRASKQNDSAQNRSSNQFWEGQGFQDRSSFWNDKSNDPLHKEYYKFKEPGWRESWRREYAERVQNGPINDRHGHKYNRSFGGRNMVALTIAMTSFVYLFIGQSLFNLTKTNTRRAMWLQQQEELRQYNSFEEFQAAQKAKEKEKENLDTETKVW